MEDTKKDGHKEVFQGGILFTADLKGEKEIEKIGTVPRAMSFIANFLNNVISLQ